jgi:hypothetical protein
MVVGVDAGLKWLIFPPPTPPGRSCPAGCLVQKCHAPPLQEYPLSSNSLRSRSSWRGGLGAIDAGFADMALHHCVVKPNIRWRRPPVHTDTPLKHRNFDHVLVDLLYRQVGVGEQKTAGLIVAGDGTGGLIETGDIQRLSLPGGNQRQKLLRGDRHIARDFEAGHSHGGAFWQADGGACHRGGRRLGAAFR